MTAHAMPFGATLRDDGRTFVVVRFSNGCEWVA